MLGMYTNTHFYQGLGCRICTSYPSAPHVSPVLYAEITGSEAVEI